MLTLANTLPNDTDSVKKCNVTYYDNNNIRLIPNKALHTNPILKYTFTNKCITLRS